jgi:hypothetical protein
MPVPVYENRILYAQAFQDITVGNNSLDGIAGYAARTGSNAASGLRRPDAVGLAKALTYHSLALATNRWRPSRQSSTRNKPITMRKRSEAMADFGC